MVNVKVVHCIVLQIHLCYKAGNFKFIMVVKTVFHCHSEYSIKQKVMEGN